MIFHVLGKGVQTILAIMFTKKPRRMAIMKSEWEKIEHIEGPQYVTYVSRMRIPGGWLYQNEYAMVFVPLNSDRENFD